MSDCHTCNCAVNPPCGACENCTHWDVDDCPNDCQTCEYDHERAGPYRLADGTWSDGVDRRIELSDREPTLNRWEVFQDEFGDWVAYCERSGKEGSTREDFPPGAFAEAIAYADRAARATQ